MKAANSETNLCGSCKLDFPSCKSNPVFGDGEDNDNVIGCDAYSVKLEIVPEILTEKKLTDREQIRRGQPERGDTLVIAGRRWRCYASDKIKQKFSLKIIKGK